MQKTVQGLLKSLLYSTVLSLSRSEVHNKLEAIAEVCASRSHVHANSAWSRSELREILARLTSVPGVKTFFLVDALDECEPQDDLEDLASEILWISKLPNVKVCVSHRPWEIFTRKFELSPKLYLDRLTLRDMESYVRGRLTSMEKNIGRHSDFQDQTLPTKKLIHDLTSAAEGVFLWTELITKAICSEMRKGKRGEQLVQVLADFPTDLDDYFHKLVFDRIGRTSRNIKDTAAALKLAVMINASEQSLEHFEGYSRFGNVENTPFAKSFVNFWLLSTDHLGPGFSWQDYEEIVQPSTELMLSHTASFLEETCKDLLVLNSSTKKVEFLHRSVFDFLTDKKTHSALEDDVPGHFSGTGFINDLARLRCICIIREVYTAYYMIVRPLVHILCVYLNWIHLDSWAPWLLTCESLTISQLRQYCEVPHPSISIHSGIPGLCMKAGLSRIVLEICRLMPYKAIMREHGYTDALGNILQATTNIEVRSPNPVLVRHVLELGCDPNAHIGSWPHSYSDRFPFGSEEYPYDLQGWDEAAHYTYVFECCSRTTWQAWLGEAYLQIHGGVNNPSDKRKQWFGMLINLLLRYGADPQCTICITDHQYTRVDTRVRDRGQHRPNDCKHITFEKLLGHIVATDSAVQLQNLRRACCDARTSHALRRNQQRRAMRSLLISEQLTLKDFPTSWSTEELRFLECLTFSPDFEFINCNGCSRECPVALATWCIECQGLSFLCLDCILLGPSEVPILTHRCSNSTELPVPQNGNHTSVVFLWEYGDPCDKSPRADRDPNTEKHVRDLRARYSRSQAITVLKEWYFKNPIELDLSYEGALRGIATLPPSLGSHPTSKDDAAAEPSADSSAKDVADSQESALRMPKTLVKTAWPSMSLSQPAEISRSVWQAMIKRSFMSRSRDPSSMSVESSTDRISDHLD